MRVLVAMTLGLAVTACQPARARFSSQDEVDIRAVYRTFARAAAAGDVAALTGLYAADVVFQPWGRTVHSSRTAAIQELWAGPAARTRAQLAVHVTEVHGEGTMAYAVGSYHLVTTMKDSTQAAPPPEEGTFVSVFGRRTDGSWKIVADNWSTTAPAAAPATAPATARRM